MSISRRDFVKDSTITAIGTSLALSSGPFAGKVLGANEKITVGVIGCGSQGRWNMRDFLRQPDVQIAAVCDVYEANLNQAREMTDGKAAAPSCILQAATFWECAAATLVATSRADGG